MLVGGDSEIEEVIDDLGIPRGCLGRRLETHHHPRTDGSVCKR